MEKMKIILVSFIVCMAIVVLAGCSATPLSQQQVSLQTLQEGSRVKCYESMKKIEMERMKALSQIPKDQLALVLVLNQSQENSKAMMSMATGNAYDPCSVGKNAFDVQIAEIKYKNQSLGKTVNGTINLGKWVAGAWAVDSVVDSISSSAGAISMIGDGNSINQDSGHISGDGNSTSLTTDNSDNNNSYNTDNSDNSSASKEAEPEPETVK